MPPLSIRPDQDVDIGHINATELLHSLFHVVLVGLDPYKEHKCVIIHLLPGWLSSQGELNGVVVKLVSPRGALLRICRLPSEPQCVDTFQYCFLGLKSLCFGFNFGKGKGFPSLFSAPFL